MRAAKKRSGKRSRSCSTDRRPRTSEGDTSGCATASAEARVHCPSLTYRTLPKTAGGDVGAGLLPR